MSTCVNISMETIGIIQENMRNAKVRKDGRRKNRKENDERKGRVEESSMK